jgi:Tfp pilus assembly protein PilN
LDLRPSSLRAKQYEEKQRPYLLGAIALLACTLLSWSFYLHYETHRFITATSQTLDFLNQEEKQLAKSDKVLAHFQKIEEKKLALCNLIEIRAQWPQLIQELQNALPARYLWITKLSPIADENNNKENSSVTGLSIEGLYLENPRQAAVVADFIARLKKSAFFSIQNQEETLLLCSSADGTAYAYPFKMRLLLRHPL